jgi:hypothetical protein
LSEKHFFRKGGDLPFLFYGRGQEGSRQKEDRKAALKEEISITRENCWLSGLNAKTYL